MQKKATSQCAMAQGQNIALQNTTESSKGIVVIQLDIVFSLLCIIAKYTKLQYSRITDCCCLLLHICCGNIWLCLCIQHSNVAHKC